MRSKWVPIAVVLLCAAASAHGAIVDQILASVDKEVILLSEVMSEIGPAMKEIRATAVDDEAFNKAVEERVMATLDQAIENKILLREATLAGVTVDDDTVEKQLEDIRKLYSSNEEFLKELEGAGETMSDLRVRLRKQLLARRMAYVKRQEFEKAAVISESDVAQYFADHQDEFSKSERVRCRQIFLTAPSAAEERAKVRGRLEEIAKELKAGANFEDLAKLHSNAPGAEDGGLIGWVARGDLVEPLDQAAFSLNEGETSDIIESENGFHILRIEKKEAAGQATLDEVRAEIEPKLRAAAAAEAYKEWMQELRKRSRVEVFI